MPYFQYQGIALKGLCTAVPANQVDIAAYGERFGEEAVQKFIQSTGIAHAHRTLPGQTACDLAYAAARNLLAAQSIPPESIGGLVLVTQSPDYRRPSSASVLHGRLKLPMDCAAMEINLGCSGFLYGLQTACSMLRCSDMQRVLLTLGETASRLANPRDKAVAMLYGDAGAALLLEKDPSAPEITVSLMSDGGRYRAIVLPAGGFRDMDAPRDELVCSDGNLRSLYDIHMDGAAVFAFTLSDVPDSIRAFLHRTGTAMEDYDCYALHQANLLILRQLIRKFHLPPEKTPISIQRYANTGGVSIPLTLCDAFGGNAAGEKRILMSAFGIGLSWGVASATVNVAAIHPVAQTDECFDEGRLTPNML